ncbi:hypothetical protein [Clostridium perfringens]|uniref:DNA polymerase III subunit beta family protein n=1 Tax=Clostridium perfringens TaxID=1502 RepID=UPI003F430FD7
MEIVLNNKNLKLIEKVTTNGIKIKSENIVGYNERENVLISLKGNDVIKEGEVNIDKNVLKYLNNKDKIIVESKDEEVFIKQNKRKITTKDFVFPNNNIDDIEIKSEKLFTITKKALQQIYEIKYAVAKDETRPILQTIHIDNESLVALDGYRLAIRKHNIKDIKDELNIPYKIFNICNKLKIEDDLDVYEYRGNIILTNGIISLQVNRIEGEYIKYKCLLPKESTTTLKVNQKDLLGLLKTYKGLDWVKFNLEEEGLLKLKAKGNITIQDELEADVKGDLKEIAFNIGYLMDTVKCYSGEITMQLMKEVSPMIIEQDDKYDLVLPIRVNR